MKLQETVEGNEQNHSRSKNGNRLNKKIQTDGTLKMKHLQTQTESSKATITNKI